MFAYGQTGSGKTWTMTGGKGDQRGLTPRVIEEIFGNIEKARGVLEVKKPRGFVLDCDRVAQICQTACPCQDSTSLRAWRYGRVTIPP